jgi:hypothetical protein
MQTLRRINLQNPVNWSHPLNKGRLVWYYLPADSGWGAGNTVPDLCKRSYGTITPGASFVPTFDTFPNGQRCLRWENGGSIDGQIDIGGATLFNFTNNFTVGCTFITETLSPTGGGGLAGLVNKYNSVGANSWFLRQNNATVEFGGSSTIASGSVLVVGQKYRAVAVMNAGTATIYLDGYSVATGSPSISSSADTVMIGEGYEPGGRNFKGRIGDVFIADRPWSEAEVIADFKLSRVDYRAKNSPLRFLELPIFDPTAGNQPYYLTPTGTGADQFYFSGAFYLQTDAQADVQVSGLGPIAGDGTFDLQTTAIGHDQFAASPPTLMPFSTHARGHDQLTISNPLTFRTTARGRNKLTILGPNGDRRILAQRRYRR